MLALALLWGCAALGPVEGGARKGPSGGASGGDDAAADGGGGVGADSADGGGETGAPADSGSPDTGDTGPAPLEEMRGVWVTRFSWTHREELEVIFDEVADAGFNAVFFQVRGNFDAYYPSALEPWAAGLTGTLGEDPGWDPLQTAIDLGHARGMQVHAYINVFPFWRGTTPPPETSPVHAYRSNPSWVVADAAGTPMALNSSYVFASPGNPSVQQRVAAVAGDIARRYDVDGIHLDYIRYPGDQYSRDATSVARYAADPGGLSWEDWQRSQVKETVAGVSAAVDVPVTAAVWGVYENRWGWSSVSEGNLDYFQDSGAFLGEGLLDANIPMIYWPVADTPGARLDFATLVADHVSRAADRHVYAGMGGEGVTMDQVIACVEAARAAGAPGVVLFDWSLFRNDLPRLKSTVFAEPAIPPAMPWRP